MLRMDEINKIKKDHHTNGLNPYQIAQKYNRSWATIKRYITRDGENINARCKRQKRDRVVITPEVIAAIENFLDDEINKKVHHKQKYTAIFIFNNLKSRGIYHGSPRSLRAIVHELRSIRNLNKIKTESFLELEFTLGHYLQVDHGPAEGLFSDIRAKGFLFVVCVPGTSIRFCRYYLTKASEAWGDFHEKVFSFFGGVFRKCIYDNDSVLKIPSTGKETSFASELQLHYGFEAIFCNKGAGHEKGSVEGSVGYCRRNFMAGLPEFESVDELNDYLWRECLHLLTEGIDKKTGKSNKQLLSEISPQLTKLPAPREWGTWAELVVDKFQCLQWSSYRYSVPEKYVGAKLKTHISASTVTVYDAGDIVVQHRRRYIENDDSLFLDHYLDQLLQKPTAIAFSKAVKQASFSENLYELKSRLRSKYETKAADIEFIKALMVRRRFGRRDFEDALEIALNFGGITANAIEAVVKQLLIAQTSPQISISQLPENCSINIEHHFDLSQYDSLI